MRLQQRKTALESTQPLVLWCILALPALALVIGVTVDYTSAFDVQQFHIPSRNCLNGCNLSYTIDNRFGIIPLNYLQIAAIIDVLPSKSSDSSVPLQWNGVVPDGQQLSCPQGWQVEIFKTSKRSDDFDGKSFCINFWNFRSNYFGSLTGVSLDGPSAHMDGHLQAIDAIIRVPPIGLHYESDITVQFVLVSPVFSDIRTIVQIIFIVLTIIVCIAFYRAVYIAKQSDPTKNVPEQVIDRFILSGAFLVANSK